LVNSPNYYVQVQQSPSTVAVNDITKYYWYLVIGVVAVGVTSGFVMHEAHKGSYGGKEIGKLTKLLGKRKQ
jgi:hypothetical protein